MRYKRKPVFVAAIQWTGNNIEEVRAFYPGEVQRIKARGGIELSRKTEYGSTGDTAYKGDYICREPSGGYAVYGKDSFEMLFELAENQAEETTAEKLRWYEAEEIDLIHEQLKLLSKRAGQTEGCNKELVEITQAMVDIFKCLRP